MNFKKPMIGCKVVWNIKKHSLKNSQKSSANGIVWHSYCNNKVFSGRCTIVQGKHYNNLIINTL